MAKRRRTDTVEPLKKSDSNKKGADEMSERNVVRSRVLSSAKAADPNEKKVQQGGSGTEESKVGDLMRYFSVITYFGVVAYMTYRTFLQYEKYLPRHRDPVLFPSWLSSTLNRGKDTTDNEWMSFTESMFWHAALMFVGYVVASRLIRTFCPKIFAWFSVAASAYLLYTIMDLTPMLHLFIIPVIYVIALKSRSRLVIWMVTVLLLVILSSEHVGNYLDFDTDLGWHYFHITGAWIISRCISYCFDTLTEDDCDSFKGLCNTVKFCFYFPLSINGPLILYKTYRDDVLLKSNIRKPVNELKDDLMKLLLNVLRLGFWAIGTELVLHYLYFWPAALNFPLLHRLDWWALSGTVYWLGQFFQMKYVVMYGIPTAVAEFDGVRMSRLPRCIAYVHRYSVMWKDFDRGLYDFLVAYTYVPAYEALRKNRFTARWNSMVLKLMASFLTFVYIYLWHSISFQVFVWSMCNFIGITIERFGSEVKRLIDSKYAISPKVWDLLIEPVVTIPLAIMSVINSSVFCGSLPTAQVVTRRFFTEHHYVVPLFYFLTSSGVAVRYWEQRKRVMKVD